MKSLVGKISPFKKIGQHEEIIKKDAEKEIKYAVCSVSPGKGISEYFKSQGVTHIIDGGQSMNPSTNDFISVIENSNAKNVILLPNNSNIILAATQAKEIIESSSDVKVEVIPSKSIIQGITSLAFFNSDADIASNYEEMCDSFDEVKYGDVTYAVRDTNMNGVDVKKGEYISLYDKNIVVSTPDINQALMDLLAEMIDEDASVITLVYGEDVKESALNQVKILITEKYEDFELEVINGGQSIYSYFIGIE